MKNITYILLLFSLSVFGQRPNNFNDSTYFARPVRFEVPPYLIQGAGSGKVITSDANGRMTWQTFSNSGVSQGALNDSINAVRSIRKVDTLYRNLDSLVFKINGIRYAIKDSSGVTQQALNDSIARLDSTIKNNSAIFPNGVKIISDTQYTLSSNDAGYYLVSISPNTHFIMPNTCPFSVGDVIGLYADLDTTTFDISSSVTGIELFTGQSSENGETFTLQCVDIGAGAEMLPLSAIIDDNGTLKTLNKYLYDQSQNAIPLSGTEVGKPVTGDIYFNDATSLVLNDGGGGTSFRVGYSGVNTFLNFQTGSGIDYITVNSDGAGASRGLVGGSDFSPNITDLDYTQKIYVDNAISSNRKVDTSYIFRNATLDSTCMITVINGNSYRSCAKDSLPTVSSTSTTTFTNKRITARVDSTTSSATPTINTDNVDTYKLTAQAVDITSFTTNLSGTPTDDQILHIVIIGTATRAITWGTKFEASTVALPTTTSGTTRLDVYFIWNTATSKWRCGGVW